MTNPDPLLITNHAVLRYLERIERRPVPRFDWVREDRHWLRESLALAEFGAGRVERTRHAIASAVKASGAPLDWPGRLVVVMPSFQAVLDGATVVTIKRPSDRNCEGSQIFEACGVRRAMAGAAA